MIEALIYKQILLTIFFKEMYEDQSGEFVFGYYIEVKGVKLV